jgi:hypothetical protein
MKGYKVFNPDWTCRGFQYEVGKAYEEDKKPVVCDAGFHFCKIATDCFNYYGFDPNNKVAEIDAIGAIAEEGDKCSTNIIKIVREVSWEELLTMVNTGKGNSGLKNSGNRNSGNRNSGNRNSGNRNSGDWNSGDWNSGDWNSGDRNSGDWNSGDRNSGNWNSGDWNSGDGNSGCFNTDDHKVLIFDKPSDMTLNQWRGTTAYYLLNRIDNMPTEWIDEDSMTDAEKSEHPEHKTTGGYLKDRDIKDCCVDWWNGLTISEKCTIQNIPNFDADKFFKITGIRV